ncbi:hypothetical protein EYF80_038633 [Liparis tanakae]|uniref:Uncharacterized protein n=1 Tax=Liparis tanakae TaxID=230148 RepID=A0A4Z2GE40_9TELE|nr:hypothetical protein EYF80_038633 [Liparis tanakae]
MYEYSTLSGCTTANSPTWTPDRMLRSSRHMSPDTNPSPPPTPEPLLLQHVVDGDLQGPGLEQQQGAEGVEERLQRLWQVGLLVRDEPRRQRVLLQLLQRHARQSGAHRLQHRHREDGKHVHSVTSSEGSASRTSRGDDVKNRFSFTMAAAFSHTNSWTHGFHKLLTFSLAV